MGANEPPGGGFGGDPGEDTGEGPGVDPGVGRHVLVLDSSFFIEGRSPPATGGALVSPLVLGELSSPRLTRRLEVLVDSGKVRVVEPSGAAVGRVKAAARETGDLPVLSDADVEVLALALDVVLDPALGPARVTLVTDDYAIQNVAAVLGVPFSPARKRPIQEVIGWEVYCPACRRVRPGKSPGDPCPVCNTALRRRRAGGRPATGIRGPRRSGADGKSF
ncbi:MAG: NOB1 family endonuclease [Promethearchaeota archaeon]